MKPIWAWDSERAQRNFEANYSPERQQLIYKKIELFCQHQLGDVEQFKGTSFLRLKLPPDRVIFYLGEESGTFWIVEIAPRDKRTYKKR